MDPYHEFVAVQILVSLLFSYCHHIFLFVCSRRT
jgi:hypothetical protein